MRDDLGSGQPLRVSVLGVGYLGAAHAVGLAELGHEVVGVDREPDKIAVLASGRAPFHEARLDDLLATHVRSGRLRFTTDLTDVIDWADVHFICVGTPQTAGGLAADLTALDELTETLATSLTRKTLVVGRSTVPFGTAQRTADRLRSGAAEGRGIGLAWNPEFLREGHAVADTLHPDRIVIGVDDAADGDLLKRLYAPHVAAGVPLIVTDLATAEMVKLAANAFLATRISFINGVAELCEATGADVTEVAAALGHDSRIGTGYLQAGLGYGGGCLPKDIRAFIARADELGVPSAAALLRSVDEINTQRRPHVVDLTRGLLDGSVTGRRIAVLGLAFKPDTDDVRESPALEVAAALQDEGATVTAYDPEAMASAKALEPSLSYAATADDALRGAEAVVLLTPWREFTDLNPVVVGDLVSQRRIVDARNALPAEEWRAAGWSYRAPGRPALSPTAS